MSKNGSKLAVIKGSKATTVADMLFSLLTLPLSLNYISGEVKETTSPSEQCILLTAVFLILALSRLFRARRFRLIGKPRLIVITQQVEGVAFLICGILPIFMGYTRGLGIQTENLTGAFEDDVRQLVGLIFWVTLLISRIMSIIRNHRWRRTVINVLIIALTLVMCVIAFAGFDCIFVATMIALMALCSIFAVVFGRIRLDVLKEIVRKTYAVEIVLGLLLLIVAFSYVFKFMEPAIPSFEDGLWYCFAIVTTIGFGDFAAMGLIGRILSVILGIYGIIVVAMITSIVVNFYGESKKEAAGSDTAEPEGETPAESV